MTESNLKCFLLHQNKKVYIRVLDDLLCRRVSLNPKVLNRFAFQKIAAFLSVLLVESIGSRMSIFREIHVEVHRGFYACLGV